MKKTCLIYGQNGLDIDVAFNLRAFYRELGFYTVFSDKLAEADLLVIVRAVDNAINLSLYHFSQIHVYDYGGWNYDACIKSLNYDISYIFTTSELHKNHLVEKLGFPSEQVFIAFPPVETSLWIEKERNIKYELVHVGNYKHKVADDQFLIKFEEAVKKYNVTIWGNNWSYANIQSNGSAGLFSVSKIYASSKFALGIMVPFQRKHTFSGRFWHAPLNGCYLISEPGIYTKKIPGVIETEYSLTEIDSILSSHLNNRSELKKEAYKFWNKEKIELINVICTLLPPVIPKNTKKGSLYLIAINNYVRYFKQQMKSYLTKNCE